MRTLFVLFLFAVSGCSLVEDDFDKFCSEQWPRVKADSEKAVSYTDAACAQRSK